LYSGKNTEECIELANKSDYGLAGTVISEDYNLAEKVAI
jgi:acyl-CoA reductase-like NAD-dependent aldehyde dehydrogenase